MTKPDWLSGICRSSIGVEVPGLSGSNPELAGCWQMTAESSS
ncbi:MAG: hypothetical protein OXF88_12480 [Rhodobacteraceae bacterium]|nr:hypothetical protein [Paracoccaceae bacterium]